jgi:replicative DNA helicase
MNSLTDVRAERTTLGLVMCVGAADGIAVLRDMEARATLEPSDFGVPAHCEVYGACLALLRQGTVPEPVALLERLRSSKLVADAGGWQWLAGLQEEGQHLLVTNFENYARQVRELAVCRRGLQLSRELAAGCTPGAIQSAIQRIVGQLNGLHCQRSSFRTGQQLLEQSLDELQRRENGEAELVIPTGIAELDAHITGLPTTLTVIGGLPGAGKSALLATLVQNLTRRGVKVAVFSLEDEAQWLSWRLLSSASGVDNSTLRTRRLSEYQKTRVEESAERLWQPMGNLLVEDRSGMTASDIVGSAHRAIVTHGVQVVIVDHLGEVKHDGRRERFDLELAEALSQLRSIAKEHKVPVVVAAHLNRKADEKPGQEPRLSQFKNASAIEEKARLALGLCREPGSDTLGICILKNTNGPAGFRVDVAFHGAAAMIRSCELSGAREFPARVADA